MRSLLRQLEQIRSSATYDDSVSLVYTSGVSETLSGTLEHDLNVIRTLDKLTKGTTNWYDDLGKYFDPTDTDASSTSNKQMSLMNIKGNTLDSKTALLAVQDDNSGAGHTVSGTTAGILVSTTTQYATPADRRGLPIFASTANAGAYHDEGGVDRTCRVDIINKATDSEIQTDAGYTIYGKLQDGADFGGTGTGTDVFVKLYANNVAITDLGTVITDPANMPSSVVVVYPYRKRLSDVLEHEWTRTTFVSSWQGDVELIEDIQNLWKFTGATDNDGSPQPWTNASGTWMLRNDPVSLMAAIQDFNTLVGAATYTNQTYIQDGETLTESLDALSNYAISNDTTISGIQGDITTINGDITDINTTISGLTSGTGTTTSGLEAALGSSTGLAGMDYNTASGTPYYVTNDTSAVTAIGTLDSELKRVEDKLDDSSGAKYIESVATKIDKNTSHATPAAYTVSSTAGAEGANMDVYVDGQLLAADTGAAGINADRDYAETDGTHVTFRFDVQAGRNVTYVIRK